MSLNQDRNISAQEVLFGWKSKIYSTQSFLLTTILCLLVFPEEFSTNILECFNKS